VYYVLTGAQAGGSLIPEVVAIETATEEAKVVVSVTGVTEGIAPEPEAAVALEVLAGAHVDAHLGASTEVVVRESEIQDAAQICSAPMAEAMSTRRGGLELLADDLVDPAVVAHNLESMRRAEQWMKVHCHTLSSRVS
jgi:uncharacterized membrane protein